jgi:hypothetical protein
MADKKQPADMFPDESQNEAPATQDDQPQGDNPEGIVDPMDGDNPEGTVDPMDGDDPQDNSQDNPGAELAPVTVDGDPEPAPKFMTGFAALDDLDPAYMAKLIRENLPDDGITIRDLPRITVPSQGRITWTYETGGEEISNKSLDGVILHTMVQRAYWEKSPEESGGFAPPDCASNDGQIGVGNPGGICRVCPLNQFKAEGGGKPCRETRILFLLQHDKRMPSTVQAPPTSIPSVRRYMTQLTTEEFLPQWAVETSLTLEKVEGGTFPYSRITPKIKERLPKETAAKMEIYVNNIKPLLLQAVNAQDLRQDAFTDGHENTPPALEAAQA